MQKLKTNFVDGQPFLAEHMNKTNSTVNELIDRVDGMDVNTIYIHQANLEEENRVSGDIRGNVIRAIRAMSHAYLGKYDATTHRMKLCQLSDQDFNLYATGQSSTLTGEQGDVFMKLPEFWWKCERHGMTPNDFAVSFSLVPREGWNHWDGKFLFGVYEAYSTARKPDDTEFVDTSVDDYNGTTYDNRTATLHSRSGIVSSGGICQAALRKEARNRGRGYCTVRWEQHTVMAMLFYAWYGHMNAQEQCGYGSNNYRKTTGKTDALGMRDTNSENGNGTATSSTSNDGVSIKFWGLENWWGNKYEWIDNIYSNNGEVRIYGEADITDPHAEVYRAIPYDDLRMGNDTTDIAYLGENFDLLPDKSGTMDDSEYGYTDYMYVDETEQDEDYYDENFEPYHLGYVGYRSGGYASSSGGVAYVYVSSGSDNGGDGDGSRLAFKGDFDIIESVEEFEDL